MYQGKEGIIIDEAKVTALNWNVIKMSSNSQPVFFKNLF